MAGKIAGAFSWASQHTFHRLGRAMLVPLFKQQHSHCKRGHLNEPLRLCLEWWQEVLQFRLKQSKCFGQVESNAVHLFADARGFPARLAAVIFADGQIFYTDCKPPAVMMKVLENRADQQIMGLELFAIALGLSTFGHLLQSKKVIVWSDNAGSQHSTAKGKAKAWDHSCIVHVLWLEAARLNTHMHVERVPSEDYISFLIFVSHFLGIYLCLR